MFGAWIAVRMTVKPAQAKMLSNCFVTLFP
jgi:hypothetical protein